VNRVQRVLELTTPIRLVVRSDRDLRAYSCCVKCRCTHGGGGGDRLDMVHASRLGMRRSLSGRTRTSRSDCGKRGRELTHIFIFTSLVELFFGICFSLLGVLEGRNRCIGFLDYCCWAISSSDGLWVCSICGEPVRVVTMCLRGSTASTSCSGFVVVSAAGPCLESCMSWALYGAL
jgi:hypothetical protein